ncbi:hypothetical protein WJX75_003401 [Coccomyxa subellipsoidea]|uniref:Uncharacterized protein n=1 Tax=Coccomyxa subellipsoidea TaxID=248742 RepID=A0ABR2YY06_9CHLO
MVQVSKATHSHYVVEWLAAATFNRVCVVSPVLSHKDHGGLHLLAFILTLDSLLLLGGGIGACVPGAVALGITILITEGLSVTAKKMGNA